MSEEPLVRVGVAVPDGAQPIEVRAKFIREDGSAYEWMWRPEVPGPYPAFLAELEIRTPDGVPIFRQPFTAHGSRLHTVCGLNDDDPDDISAVES